jgi:hypothetical protein
VVAVAARIGDSPKMVLLVYGHLMPDTEEATRKAIDTAWSGTAWHRTRLQPPHQGRLTLSVCPSRSLPITRAGGWRKLKREH